VHDGGKAKKKLGTSMQPFLFPAGFFPFLTGESKHRTCWRQAPAVPSNFFSQPVFVVSGVFAVSIFPIPIIPPSYSPSEVSYSRQTKMAGVGIEPATFRSESGHFTTRPSSRCAITELTQSRQRPAWPAIAWHFHRCLPPTKKICSTLLKIERILFSGRGVV